MIKPIHILLLVLLSGYILIQGCKTERDPCLEPRITLLKAGAYKHVTDTSVAVKDTALPSPTFTALTTFTTSNNFIQTAGRNKFNFQLSNVSDTCRWVIRPDTLSNVRDTLTFYYQRQLRFLSNACGYTYYYNLDTVTTTKHAIHSVRVGSRDVTSNASVENLQIYY